MSPHTKKEEKCETLEKESLDELQRFKSRKDLIGEKKKNMNQLANLLPKKHRYHVYGPRERERKKSIDTIH